jgi:hypothetical protein
MTEKEVKRQRSTQTNKIAEECLAGLWEALASGKIRGYKLHLDVAADRQSWFRGIA